MTSIKRNWKATTAMLALGLTLSQASLMPRQSHAIVAIASGGTAIPALIVLGAGALVTGAELQLLGAALCAGLDGRHCGRGGLLGPVLGRLGMANLVILPVGVLAVLTGLVMLDESGAPTPDFQKLTPAKAQEASITNGELRAFNRQLDRINSVSESIARGFASKQISDAKVAVEFAHSEWTEAHERGLISNNAFSALTKLSAKAVQQVQAVR